MNNILLFLSCLLLVSCNSNLSDPVDLQPTLQTEVTSPNESTTPSQESIEVIPTENNNQAVTTTATEGMITAEEAKQIALEHAGQSADTVSFVQTELDYENGIQVYEIEFYVGNLEFDYEIHAKTGDILSFDQEMETPRQPVTSTTATEGMITAEEAKQIALGHAGQSADSVSFVKTKLDYDDGIQVYEIEFYVGNLEFDYEIHAKTGDILSFDQEMETPRPETTSTDGTLITEETAKNIALTHAGFTEGQVSSLRVKLDYDDGISEYEVEFRVGTTEYEYEIHGTTGNILSVDVDKN